MKNLITETIKLLSKRERFAIAGLLLLIILVSVSEVFGIAVVIPFLHVLQNPDLVNSNPHLALLYKSFGPIQMKTFFLLLGVVLIVAMSAKYVFVLFASLVQSLFLLRLQIRFEGLLLRSYLYSDYEFHLNSNPSFLFQRVRTVQALTSSFMLPAVSILSEGLISLSMLILLVSFKPKITLTAILSVMVVATCFWMFTRSRLYRYGIESHSEGTEAIKWLNQSFIGIKDIKISGNEKFFEQQYSARNYNYARILQKMAWFNQSSRPLLENLGFVLLVSYILYHVASDHQLSEIVPTLILFAGAAFRVFPAFNRILSQLMLIRQSHKIVADILGDLKTGQNLLSGLGLRPNTDLSFSEKIEVQDLSFKYQGAAQNALDGINLKIRKGEFIGIIGSSGSGKTTFIDILLGLMPNYGGNVLVDGKPLSFEDGTWGAWQKKIGYVPQSVYLYDETILKNIAFGIPASEIDHARVEKAMKNAKIYDWVKGLPDMENTFVGERGVRVSGGQKQRIGIARAFYRGSELLVLDEVTSALDQETESEMLEEFNKLRQNQNTIIMITHKMENLRFCSNVFVLKDGAFTLRPGSA